VKNIFKMRSFISPFFYTGLSLLTAVLSACGTTPETEKACSMKQTPNNAPPFLILRHMGSISKTPDYAEELFRIHDEFPGVIDEIWFSTGITVGASDEEERRQLERLRPLAAECRKRGIIFSIQTGTLGNLGETNSRVAAAEKSKAFSGKDWMVDWQGKTMRGMLCPTSEAARKRLRERAELHMRELKPGSYWPDDDLRVDGKSIGCFCERCLKQFNQETGHNFKRQELVNALWWDKNPSGRLREEWINFNNRNLTAVAAVFREAADKACPECRIGIQGMPAFGRYNGFDKRSLLEAAAGGTGCAAIRPGGGYYSDARPREMLEKALLVAKEGARCSRYGFVNQICYEAENWPHISMLKTPDAEMKECALMLFAGADSLALYWHDAYNRETPGNSRLFLQAAADYRPFFELIRDTAAHTLPGGIAFYCAKSLEKAKPTEWAHTIEPAETVLWENAVPLGVQEASPEVLAISERCAGELTEADFPELSGRVCLIEAKSFVLLQERFPSLGFAGKVRCVKPETPQREIFDGKSAHGVNWALKAESPDVRTLSSLSGMEGFCGSCVVPTGKGGAWIVVQQFANWTFYRRKAILDALDSLLPEGLSIRLEPGGFAVAAMSRLDKTEKTRCAYLINTSIGKTPELKLKIRRGAFRNWEVRDAEKRKIPVKVLSSTERETEIEIPSLAPWQGVLVRGY